MRKFYILVCFMVVEVGCGKTSNPPGTLGKCTQSYQGLEFCTDYSFETTSSKNLTDDARAAAKSTCGNNAWTDNEACSLTGAVGYCSFSVAKTAGSESYTLKYKAVYGALFLGGASNLKSLCEAANVSPITATWTGL